MKITYSVPTRILRFIIMILAAVAGIGIIAMILITCVDVIGRLFAKPLLGSYDLVKLTSTIIIAAALPYTTAIKGHVAIEYFFQKLRPAGRLAVDTVCRTMSIVFFAFLAYESVLYGNKLQLKGEVSPTLQLPVFWVGYVIAFSCVVMCLVIFYHLVKPGKELIKP